MAILVGRKAPSFKATAVVDGESDESFSLDRYLGKQYVLLYFYPRDFDFVSATEILGFQQLLTEFETRGVAVVGVSTDSHLAHVAWLNIPRERGGITGVTHPLVADPGMTIAKNYDVLGGSFKPNAEGELTFVGVPEAYRGLFLIDRDGIVRHQVVNDSSLGRNTAEALRMVNALQYTEKNGSGCPADWKEGQPGVSSTRGDDQTKG